MTYFFPKRTGQDIPASSIFNPGQPFSLSPTAGRDRDEEILSLVARGQIPAHLREPLTVSLTDGTNELLIEVMPDVLSVGTDNDFVRVSLAAPSMVKLAEASNAVLITPKISDAIWQASGVRLAPIPEPWHSVDGGRAMLYTQNLAVHSKAIDASAKGADLSKGIAGIKKDVVLSGKLGAHPGKVAIYGWHKLDGKPIQGLNITSHELTYQDYSHGVRLAGKDARIRKPDGSIENVSLAAIMADPKLSKLVSDDGPITTSYSQSWPAGTDGPTTPVKPPPVGPAKPPPAGPPVGPVKPPPPASDDGSGSILLGGAILAIALIYLRKR